MYNSGHDCAMYLETGLVYFHIGIESLTSSWVNLELFKEAYEWVLVVRLIPVRTHPLNSRI